MFIREQNITSTRLRTSYLSSVISTALVLFLLGVAGLLIYNANQLSSLLREVTVSVYLHDSIENKEAMDILGYIEKQKYVQKVKFISKEDAALELQHELGKEFLDFVPNNPLPIVLEVTIKKDFFIADSVATVKANLMSHAQVKDVIYQKKLLDEVSKNTEKISIVIMIFVVLLLFVSIFLINNTIRLIIYSKRFLINTMKLVGASTSFIRTPFLASSVWQGIISGIIAIVLLFGLISILRNDFSEFLELTNAKMFATLFACMLLLGSVISFISTYIIVTRYTKLTSDDLYV